MNMHPSFLCEEIGFRITDLDGKQCRYPISSDPEHRFCGSPVMSTRTKLSVMRSYCREHFKIVAAPHVVRAVEASHAR